MTITTREEMKSIIIEAPGGAVVLKNLEPFEHMEDFEWTMIARALISVQTETMRASNDRWAEVVK